MARWLKRASTLALDAVLPPLCLGCRTPVAGTQGLCPSCWGRITWLGPPLCACCGTPFPFDPDPAGDPGEAETLLCGACLRDPPPFAHARAAFVYDEASRGLILGFKHADRTQAAPAFGAWLARSGAALLAEADLVAPVPLHWTRLLRRRFNQSALLAQQAASATARAYVPDLLVRERRTRSQGGLDRDQRRRNVRRAFAVRPCYQERIAGARVVIVDDVYTTGATLAECAKVLLRAGAGAVDVLTLARVVRPMPD